MLSKYRDKLQSLKNVGMYEHKQEINTENTHTHGALALAFEFSVHSWYGLLNKGGLTGRN